MNDELRDRIKQSMIDALSRNFGGGTYDDAAQAIIDELGLEYRYWITYSGTHLKQASGRVECQ